MLKIRLTMEEPQNEHSLTVEQECKVHSDLGEDVITRVAAFINYFLHSYGYLAYDKEYVFLESVTADEYDQLVDYLCKIREENVEH